MCVQYIYNQDSQSKCVYIYRFKQRPHVLAVRARVRLTASTLKNLGHCNVESNYVAMRKRALSRWRILKFVVRLDDKFSRPGEFLICYSYYIYIANEYNWRAENSYCAYLAAFYGFLSGRKSSMINLRRREIQINYWRAVCVIYFNFLQRQLEMRLII